MHAASRLARAVPRVGATARPAAARAMPTIAQRAAFSMTSRALKSEVIKETEVPVTVYSPDHKGVASGNQAGHFNIPVKNGAAEAAAEEELEIVTPLEDKVYSQLPRTMQKMSVHGKVIIITG